MGDLNKTGITKTSRGTEVAQFTSHGKGYDTLAGVAIRLGQLAFENHINGASDGRVTEMETIMGDLEAQAQNMGADHPVEAVRMALESVRFVNSHMEAPVLSVWEELDIAVINTNEGKRTGAIN